MKFYKLIRAASAFALSASALLSFAQIAHADITMPYGSGTTTYAFLNVGGATSTVVASYYRPDGTEEPGSQKTFASIGTKVRQNVNVGNAADATLPASWKGSVVLSSDNDLVATAVTNYTGKPSFEDPSQVGSTPGTEASMYDAFNAGATELYAPVIARLGADGGAAVLTSRMTVQNTTSSATSVYFNWYQASGATKGTFLGQKVVALNGYGSVTIDSAVNTDMPAVFNGSAAVYVTSTQPIVGIVEQSWNSGPQATNWSADYSMLPPDQKANVVYSPTAARLCPVACTFNPGTAYPTYNFFTQATLMNTTDVTATGTAEFYNTAGALLYTVPVTISKKSGWTVNMYNGSDVSASSGLWAALPKNYQGSIKFTMDQPVVGVGFIQQPIPAQNFASAFGLVSASGSSNTVIVPQYERVCAGTAPCSNVTTTDQWTAYSNFSIVNVGSSPVTLSNVQYINANGTLQLQYNQTDGTEGAGNITLNPGVSYGFSAFNGSASHTGSIATSQALGVSFRGSAWITAPAGAQLKATSTLVQGRISADAYNAFNR